MSQCCRPKLICRICNHPNLIAIEREILSKPREVSYSKLGKRLECRGKDLYYHRWNHMPEPKGKK